VTYGHSTSSSLPNSTAWELNNPTCDDLDYSILKPLPHLTPIPVSGDKPTVMFLNFTFPTMIDGVPRLLVNGQDFNVSDNAYPTLFHVQEDPSWKESIPGEQRNILTIPDSLRGKQIQLVIRSEPTNLGAGHPFHAHGRGYKIIATGTGNFTQQDLDNVTPDDVQNAITRDTVIVPKSGWVITQRVTSLSTHIPPDSSQIRS